MAEFLSPKVDIQEVDSRIRGIRRAAATIPGFVGVTEKGPVGTPVLITSFNQFRRVFGTYLEAYDLAYAVEHFFKYVNGRCYVARTVHYTDIADPSTSAAVAATVTLVDRFGTPEDTLEVTASSPGAWGNGLTVSVALGYDDSVNEFDLTVKLGGVQVEEFKNLSMIDTDDNYVETMINLKSAYIVVTDLDSVTVPPDDQPAVAADTALTTGDDGLTSFTSTDVVGSSAGATGLYALNARYDISLIAAPGFTDQTVHEGIVTFCEQDNKFCFGILESALAMLPAALETYVRTTAGFNTRESAIFYPWVKMQDPRTRVSNLFSPSGHICGIMARTVENRGIHKAAAGVDDGRLFDVLDLEFEVDLPTRDVLYPARINCLKKEPGIGEVVWGNRTLSYDTNWEQISVRRCFHNIARSILNGTQFLVFEPNNEDTRAKCRDTIAAFLNGYWKEGALYDGGSGNPDDAYYVVCDSSNNSQYDVDEGKLICDIGLVFTRAAEFVIFRISQWDGGRILEEITTS